MLALNSLRKGHKYRVVNFSDIYEFEIVQILSRDEFLLKDLYTYEKFYFSDITRYGKSEDFSIDEL